MVSFGNKTTYDDIFQSFIVNGCGSLSDLPSEDEGKYAMINNAFSIYKMKTSSYRDYFRIDFKCSDIMEHLNVKLNDNELLVFSHCLKLAFLKNQYSNFTSVWSTFTKEVGQKNYKAQIDARKSDIAMCENMINEVLENAVDDWEV